MTRTARLLLLALLPLAACEDGMKPDPVATVEVTPQGPTLLPGTTLQLTAKVKNGSGAELTDRAIVWETTNASIASVDAASGLVTAVASGTATITARSEGQSGSTTVTVAPSAASINLAPDSANLAVGATQR